MRISLKAKKKLSVFLLALVLAGGVAGFKADTAKAWYTEPTTYVKSLAISWGINTHTFTASNSGLPTTRLKIYNRGDGAVTVYYRSSSKYSYSKVAKLYKGNKCYVSLSSTGQLKITKTDLSSTVLEFYR